MTRFAVFNNLNQGENGCQITGVESQCGDSAECCSLCCSGGSCLSQQVCAGICLKTDEYSWCTADSDCCGTCCQDHICVDESNCAPAFPLWALWILAICGGLICLSVLSGIASYIYRKCKRRFRYAGPDTSNVSDSRVDTMQSINNFTALRE